MPRYRFLTVTRFRVRPANRWVACFAQVPDLPNGQIFSSDGAVVCWLLQDLILHHGRRPQPARHRPENSFFAALGWWAAPRLPRRPLTLWRLVAGGAATPDKAALACSSAALTPRTIGGQAEAAARSLRLPTAPSPPTQPQPATDICPVLCVWPCREPVVAVRGGREGLDELPSDLGWLLMCGDPGERQGELSTPPTPPPPPQPPTVVSVVRGP